MLDRVSMFRLFGASWIPGVWLRHCLVIFPSFLLSFLPILRVGRGGGFVVHSTFTATLYTSPSSTARYADDEDAQLRELCVWKADVGQMPAFKDGVAKMRELQGRGEGFYTSVYSSFSSFKIPFFLSTFVFRRILTNMHRTNADFLVGLEIDSAEVRGVLLDADPEASGGVLGSSGVRQKEWGRVVFAFM
ncbi:hypothetical protein R3P38DRAFT_882531 [Favolaschia claudopus]|uniref:Uncharacterized protein n=1 Tax=Favolaschia claudopus TaxID=2862362 RepID=A0AAW0BR87_9AGAR